MRTEPLLFRRIRRIRRIRLIQGAGIDDELAHARPRGGARLARLMTAMYAAWAIRRDLITPESAEDDAELVVRVRCGEFPDAELSELYLERHDSLSAEAQMFFDDYSGGRIPLADQDFSRLVSSVKLTTSEASIRRVAEILDARFDAWQRTHLAGAGSDDTES